MLKLYARQLAKARRETGEVDLSVLGELVVSAYEDAERDRRRTDRSIAMMAEELGQVYQRLVDALEIMPEGIALFGADDRLVTWNRRYAEMYGLTGAIAVGASFEDLLRAGLATGQYADAVGREEEWIAERLARHRQPSDTHEQHLSDGRWVRVEERRTADGGSIGARIDITDLKRREASFRLLFENNPIPMFVCDAHSLSFLAVNGAAVAHYGYSQMQLLGMSVYDLRRPEDWDDAWHLAQTGAGNHQSDQIQQHVKADGTPIEVSIYSRPLEYQNRPATLFAVIDVTDRRRVESKLVEQRLQLDAALNNMVQGLCMFDADGQIVLFNQRYVEMMDLSAGDLMGLSLLDLFEYRKKTGQFTGDPKSAFADALAGMRAGKSATKFMESIDGRILRVVDQPMDSGGWVATFEDITEQRKNEGERDRDREFLTQIVDNVPVMIAVKDASTRKFVLANRTAEEYWGISRAEVLGKTARELFPQAQADVIDVHDDRALESEVPLVLDAHPNMARSGDRRTVTSKRLALRDSDGKPQFLVSVVEDVTDRRRIEQERDRNREFLNQIIDNVPTTILVKNALDRRYVLINRAAESYFGMSRDKIIGKTVYDIYPKPDADEVTANDEQSLQCESHLFSGELSVQTLGAGHRIVTNKRFAIDDNKGEPQYLINVIDDVTERKRTDELVRHLAHYDALTDLPNRVLFREQLEQALKWVDRGERLAVLYLDLDQFKSVNNTLGHPVGDESLKAVAARLRGCLRETDIFARLSGDEFVIVQTATAGPSDVINLVNRIHEEIRKPFHAGGHQLVTDTSIGIAMAPEDGTDPDHLLKNADLAMYGAKADGRGTYRFFEPDMDARVKARRALEFDLREAIMCGGFELHYQPLSSLQDDKITGCEALLRWPHPQRGMISPVEFIPVAEETGLINQLGEWVLRTACAEATTWPDDIKVAVNVSPVQFKSGNLVQMVISALAASRLPAHRLELEITETVLIRDDEKALALLHQLRGLGVRIAMDDFGTGYSSLSYLQRFPFDKIKIDRCFIKDIAEADGSLTIVQAVVAIAKSRNITTTAEGVETKQQKEVLRTLGCTEMQGYLFSPARPAAEVLQLLLSVRDKAAAVA